MYKLAKADIRHPPLKSANRELQSCSTWFTLLKVQITRHCKHGRCPQTCLHMDMV